MHQTQWSPESPLPTRGGVERGACSSNILLVQREGQARGGEAGNEL